MGQISRRRMAARWLPLALLPLLLTPCEARPSLHPTSTVLYRSTAHGGAREASLPAVLGTLVPDVSGYRCSGTYQPALAGRLDLASLPPQVGTPLWQLSVTCVDPRLTAGVSQGPVPPRAVLLFEYPSTLANWERTVTHVRRISLDGRLAALSDIGYAGYELGVLGFARGESSWQVFGMHLRRSVLVSHFGRQVPVRVLEAFARNMEPFPWRGWAMRRPCIICCIWSQHFGRSAACRAGRLRYTREGRS